MDECYSCVEDLGGAANAEYDYVSVCNVCGDGVVYFTGGELCDDNNTVSGDGCSFDCLTIEPGFTCTPIN